MSENAKADKKFSLDDFAAMLEKAETATYRKGFDPGESVAATVMSIGEKYVTLEVNAKQEGLLPVEDAKNAAGEIPFKAGDKLNVVFSGMQNGAFIFGLRLEATKEVDRTLADAFATRMPVEGLVQKEVNGGWEVTVAGQRAFCPYSQIALRREEGVQHSGQKYQFLVTEFGTDERGTNLIVSRRALLEQEREKQKEELKEDLFVGMIASGTVTRLADFGAFVELGGAEGLIPLREISWERGVKPEDILKPGDKVDVQIKELDWEKNRISLSLRGAKADPFEEAVKKFPKGTAFNGKVVKLENFGAFIQLVPGVEGLVPISKLGRGRRLANAREVLSEGQEILVEVESIDAERRRFSLNPVNERVRALEPGELAIGAKVQGIVESVQPFGVFVRLSEEKTGLLHISETDLPKGISAASKLEKMFPADEKIEVIIKGIDGNRISLTLPSTWERKAQEAQDAVDVSNWLADNKKESTSFGSLGDAFADLKL